MMPKLILRKTKRLIKNSKVFQFLFSRKIRVWRFKIAPIVLLFLVFCLPAILQGTLYYQQKRIDARYTYVTNKEKLIGEKSSVIASQIVRDTEKELFLFNKKEVQDEVKPLVDLQKTVQSSEAESGMAYSAEIGIKKPTVKIFENQLGVSFGSELLMQTKEARKDGSWIVYPTHDENVTVVYSIKSNGIKEDIIVKQAVSDEMSFAYSLDLPKSLDAKLLDDGSLGIYSADPSNFSNMTFGSEADQELIEKVKENSEKTYLVFTIPKPVIVAENGNIGDSRASFAYDRETKILTVKAYKLMTIQGVFSIDPTVVVTSTADFGSGNNEGGMDYLTSNAISNPTVRGGTTGSWSNANTGGNAGGARVNQATTVYNGYLYIIGGWTGSVQTRVDYGPIDSSGNVTSWTQDTDSALPHARTGHKAVAYNGYMYVIGGCNAYTNYGSPYFNNCTPGTNKNHDAGLGGAWMRSVAYAQINSDGSLGAWTTDTDYFTNAREWHSAGVYNGRLYIAGGRIDSHPGTANTVNDVQYAPILTDGSIGTWTTDGGTSFTTDRMYTEMSIYNGYMYILGGYNEESFTYLDDVQYAPINEDGSIGTWATTNNFSDTRGGHKVTNHRGYLYMVGGYDGATKTDLQYAPINSNGSIGLWASTTTVSSRDNVGLHAWGDYLIWLSGDYVTNYCEKSQLDINGTLRSVSSAWPTTNTTSTFRNLAPVVAHNGYMYQVGGGNTSAVPQSSGDRVAINADGTLGTWSTTGGGTLGTARQAHGVAVYNGYIYAVGGLNSSGNPISSIEYAQIDSSGNIGTWNTTTALSGNRAYIDVVAFQGYLYVLGGDDFGGGGGTTVEYFTIDSAGTLSSRTAGTSLPATSANPSAFAYNGYMYITGGDNSSTNTVRNTIHRATITASSGALGSWSAMTTLPSSRSGHTTTVSNGLIYVIGGCTTFASFTCSTWTNNTHVAPINTDGSIGSFTQLTSLANTKWNHGAVAYNGYLYAINGRNGSNQQQTEYVRLNAGGAGDTLSWTSSSNSLGTATTDHASVIYNGYLYTLGGCTTYTSSNCTAFSSAVQYAAINKGGTVGTSATSSAFTTGRYGHSVAVRDGYIYLTGGCSASTGGTCTNYLNDVQYARINSDGTLGAWQTTTSFTTARHSHKSTIYGRFIYVTGGDTGSVQSGVQYASIGNDGALSSGWTSTTALGTARRDHALTTNNGYVYAVGGYTGSVALSSVEFAQINSDGTIGTWSYTTPLVYSVFAHGASVYNGRLYVIGGCSAGTCTTFNNKTHQAEIFANGRIGSWDTSINNFTTARTDAGYVMNEGMVYVTGGCSAGSCTTIQSNISHTGLTVYPLISEFSKALNLGSGGRSVSSLSYTGTNTGTVNAKYSYACTTTTYSNRTSLAYTLDSGERAVFSQVDADYLMVFLIFDAAFNRTFPNSSQIQIQDFTVGYTAAHPDASETMRHGNTFIDQVEIGFGARPEGTASLGC